MNLEYSTSMLRQSKLVECIQIEYITNAFSNECFRFRFLLLKISLDYEFGSTKLMVIIPLRQESLECMQKFKVYFRSFQFFTFYSIYLSIYIIMKNIILIILYSVTALDEADATPIGFEQGILLSPELSNGTFQGLQMNSNSIFRRVQFDT